MSFQPVVPFGGLAGWQFLQRTLDAQQNAFRESPQIIRDSDYFRGNIANVQTADDLVNDRRLLSVALGAFGLSEDIGNKAFIARILSDGSSDPEALANRLSDKRYLAFSQAFGLGPGEVSLTGTTFFAEDIIDRFESQSFAVALGNTNGDMRLALNLAGGLEEVLAGAQGNDARWFSILGNAPLRKVVETALGLPASIAAIDLDQQLSTFKDRASRLLGTDDVAELNSTEARDDLVRLFLIRSDASQSLATSAGSTALQLLQSAPISF